ncbi:right-handed parallel beta-helix repeat-containing protein [Myxococcus sp. QH3KD-4-1]|nr:right-handed parallel beta-helix repeat-containing protein [Myxococcus qinghaiensis]
MFSLTMACGVTPSDLSEGEPELMESESKVVEPREGMEIYLDTCPTATVAPGSTLFVSNRGPWNPAVRLGSGGNPYRTIVEAVKAAKAGNIIEVRAGTYPEQVVIDSATSQAGTAIAPIVLRGQSLPNRPRLVPPTDRVVGSVLSVSQPYWIIQGMEIDLQGKASFGALFTRNTYCTQLISSEIHGGTAGGGVVVSNANNVLIHKNLIYNFSRPGADSHGVLFRDASRDIYVLENEIRQTSGDSVQCQIDGNRAVSLFVENNELHDAGENGIDIKGCDSLYLRFNNLHDFGNLTLYPWAATSSAAEGIVIHEDATNVQIIGNVIQRAGRGISVGGTANTARPLDVLIRNNTITDIFNFQDRGNGQGIRVVQANRIQIRTNLIERTADAGMRLAADEPLGITGLIATNNIFRDMPLFVRLGRKENRLLSVIDRNRYEGPTGVFTATGLVNEGQFPAWRTALAPEGLEQNSVRIP